MRVPRARSVASRLPLPLGCVLGSQLDGVDLADDDWSGLRGPSSLLCSELLGPPLPGGRGSFDAHGPPLWQTAPVQLGPPRPAVVSGGHLREAPGSEPEHLAAGMRSCHVDRPRWWGAGAAGVWTVLRPSSSRADCADARGKPRGPAGVCNSKERGNCREDSEDARLRRAAERRFDYWGNGHCAVLSEGRIIVAACRGAIGAVRRRSGASSTGMARCAIGAWPRTASGVVVIGRAAVLGSAPGLLSREHPGPGYARGRRRERSGLCRRPAVRAVRRGGRELASAERRLPGSQRR